MAQIPFRTNLQSAQFPLLASQSGRTVVDGGPDQVYVPGVNPQQAGAPADRGIAQVFHGQNILPTTYGYQSCGYWEIIQETGTPPDWEGSYFSYDYYEITSVEGRQVTLQEMGEFSTSFWYLNDDGTWTQVTDSIGQPDPTAKVGGVTTATVNGVTYFYVYRTGCYTYSDDTKTFTEVTLEGLDPETIEGIATTNGYLIAYSLDGVSWSSVNDPLDFTPSEVSGSGGGQVQELRGPIRWVSQTQFGLIIWTSVNAVSCVYSGNSSFPFNFRELPNTGGIEDKREVSQYISSQGLFAYTKRGIQQVTHQGAQSALPFVVDYLSGKKFELYDYLTDTVTPVEIQHVPRRMINYISDRYVVISYGLDLDDQFSHALIFDLGLGRLGKVAIGHQYTTEMQLGPEGNLDEARESLAFVDQSGAVNLLVRDNRAEHYGVIWLGKFQAVRQRHLQLQQVETELDDPNAVFTVSAKYSLNGKDVAGVVDGYLSGYSDYYRSHLFNHVGINHTLSLQGRFSLSTILLWFNVHGRY